MFIFTRRRPWTTSLLIVLIMMMCVMGVLVNVQGAQAKSLSPHTPNSYYVESFHETADGVPYTIDARGYPQYNSDNTQTSTMYIPQVDAYDAHGHFEWSMTGAFAEFNANGVNYASISLNTSGPQGVGTLSRQIQWYPPISKLANTGCKALTSPYESPWGDAYEAQLCGTFPYSYPIDAAYDSQTGGLDSLTPNLPTDSTFDNATEAQRMHIDNIVNNATSSHASVSQSTAIHSPHFVAWAAGLSLLVAGLALTFGGGVMASVAGNRTWLKYLGALLGTIGTACIIGGGVVVGPLVAPYVLGQATAAVGDVALANVVEASPGLSSEAINAAYNEIIASLQFHY